MRKEDLKRRYFELKREEQSSENKNALSLWKNQRGFSVADLLIWGAVVGVMLTIIGVASIYFSKWKEKQVVSSEFNIILTGLDTYRQETFQYPSGTGWTWNVNNAYVPAEIVNKGWQYSCSSNTITITTPPIANAKILAQIANEFSKKCDNSGTSGNTVVCQLVDKPC